MTRATNWDLRRTGLRLRRMHGLGSAGVGLLVVVLLQTIGCGQPDSSVEGSRAETTVSPGADKGPGDRDSGISHSNGEGRPDTSRPPESTKTISGLSTKLKFKTDSGATAFSIKPQDDGGKLVDGKENELARFNLSGDKMKIKDPSDVVILDPVQNPGF